jgi:hypothetical protein
MKVSLDRTVSIVVCIVCMAGGLPGPARAASPRPATRPANPRFGMNLERLIPWSRSRTYIDVVRTAYGFDTIAKVRDGKADLGPNGWPSRDFGVLLIEGAAPSMGGTYKIVFPGTVEQIRAGHGAKVRNQTVDARTGTVRADLTFDPAASASLDVRFIGAKLTGRLKVIRPGYTEADEASKVFTDEFLTMLKAVSPGVIRGMDFVVTNSNPVAHWADRPTHDSPMYSETGGHGGPVEDLIDICNRHGADLWLNVPVGADDEYRKNLAELVKQQLRPDLNVYLEFGNENWNRAFGQHQINLDAAAQERSAGVPFDPSPEIAGWQRTARETARLGTVFRAALGPQRVRPVLCGQGVNPATLSDGLEFLAKNVGPPSEHLYGIANAPYSAITPDMAANDWHVLLLNGKHVQAQHQLAKKWGLASCCYESGPDYTGTKLDPAGQKDPRMEDLLYAYWQAWKGDGPLLQYNICNSVGPGKIFGLTDDVVDLTQPKFKAAERFASKADGFKPSP